MPGSRVKTDIGKITPSRPSIAIDAATGTNASARFETKKLTLKAIALV
jgi:hypothetical protein